jgi:hypothetical protein
MLAVIIKLVYRISVKRLPSRDFMRCLFSFLNDSNSFFPAFSLQDRSFKNQFLPARPMCFFFQAAIA